MDVTKILEAFKDAGDRMDGMDGDMDQMKKIIGDLQTQLKTYARHAFSRPAGSKSNSFWPTEEHAKQFGGLVLKALGRYVSGSDDLECDALGRKALSGAVDE